MGYLPDGKKVIARRTSSDETPTLEIQDPQASTVIKIRYRQ